MSDTRFTRVRSRTRPTRSASADHVPAAEQGHRHVGADEKLIRRTLAKAGARPLGHGEPLADDTHPDPGAAQSPATAAPGRPPADEGSSDRQQAESAASLPGASRLPTGACPTSPNSPSRTSTTSRQSRSTSRTGIPGTTRSRRTSSPTARGCATAFARGWATPRTPQVTPAPGRHRETKLLMSRRGSGRTVRSRMSRAGAQGGGTEEDEAAAPPQEGRLAAVRRPRHRADLPPIAGAAFVAAGFPFDTVSQLVNDIISLIGKAFPRLRRRHWPASLWRPPCSRSSAAGASRCSSSSM